MTIASRFTMTMHKFCATKYENYIFISETCEKKKQNLISYFDVRTT